MSSTRFKTPPPFDILLRRSTLGILFLIACFLFPLRASRAENSGNSDQVAVGQGSLATVRKEVMLGNGDSATLDRDGRDLNLGGYERSPILFDPLNNDSRTRIYPQLTAQREYSRDYEKSICRYKEQFPPEFKDMCNKNDATSESLGNELVWKKVTGNMLMTNLMVDDEIHKAEMGIFWDPEYLRSQFLNDTQQLNTHLDTLNTPIGIAGTALDFLDKAVAASVSTTRVHADTNTMLQILRQVNLNTSQIANPDRIQLYKDHAEKFEACMWAEGDKSNFDKADGSSEKPMFKHVNFTLPEALGGKNCLEQDSYCRKLYSGKIEKDGQTATTKGLYQFCMCCADKVVQMNDSTVNKIEDSTASQYKLNLCDEYLTRVARNDTTGYRSYGRIDDIRAGSSYSDAKGRENVSYSLVERVFMGLDYTPKGSGTSDSENKELRKIVSSFAHYFQDIYGDVCIFETKGDSEKAGFIRKQFVSPFWSVPQLVDMMRNGKPDGSCDRLTQYCPITGEEVTVGICPAFKLLVSLEYKGELHKALIGEGTLGLSKDDIQNYWVQATLGDTLTARDFQNVVRNFQKHPEFNRFIETFCDASAGAAVKKLHARMMSIALDHLLLNQKITEEDRKMVRRLMDRVSDYLGLAAQDTNSVANSMVIASEIQRNRLDQADRGSFVASALGASRNSAQMDELDAPFGGAAPSSALRATP